VQTCKPTGEWGTPWPCATGVCNDDACSGFTTAGASCQTGATGQNTCGASGESCCASLEVPGGSYDRTFANSGTGATDLADPATVSGFRLDKYLVTVGRFRQFVAAWNGGHGYLPAMSSGLHAHLAGGSGLTATAGGHEPGWVAADNDNIAPTDANLACDPTTATWTPSVSTQENLPINCVNWYEAYAFCIWDGGFLPSEAEWEYAAAGGSEQREYPWGSTDPGTLNLYAIYGDGVGSYYSSGGGGFEMAPVGSATQGAARWGQLDLAGEAWEWNLDWFDSFAPCSIDCADFTPLLYRVIRGGEFLYDQSYLLSVYRSGDTPSLRASDVGIRCARAP
jgi:formylglycine-generating enzyme required for sulfatase activity